MREFPGNGIAPAEFLLDTSQLDNTHDVPNL
jgi:hypothetical protein